MANRLQKLLYFLSAEAPIMVMASVVWAMQRKVWIGPIIIVVIAVALIVIFNRTFIYAEKNLPSISVTTSDLKSADAWLVAYVITYLLPFASLAFADYVMIIVCVVFIILAVVLTFTDYVTPHPWLYLRGYHFYNINVEGAATEYTLISKKRLRKAEDVHVIARVFEFLLIREK